MQSHSATDPMNVPNQLTIARFFLTILFLIVYFVDFPFSNTVALTLFSLAALTDYYDGKIARRDKLITNFGILMDPMVDKILVCSAYIAMVGEGRVAAWVAIVIVSREIAITGLRLLAASKDMILPAEKLGKYKTTSQMVALIALLTVSSYPEWGALGSLVFSSWAEPFTWLSVWISALLTLVSGIFYLWKNRELFINDL